MPSRVPNPCLGASLSKVQYPAPWYGVRELFTPSNKQLKGYASFNAHKPVMNRRNDPPTITFDENAIKVLLKRYPDDPLYKLIADYREYEKCLGTYLGGIVPSADGRYREEFKHNPKTLRLAMKILQLLPRSDDAESVYSEVRGLFIASPGKVMLSRDFGGIEAKIVAYLAGDPNFLRLTDLDVHGFIASQTVGKIPDLSWSDSDLLAFFDELKNANETFELNGSKMSYDVIRTACKRALYLSLYGGGPSTMVEKEPKIFTDFKVAKFFQDLILDTFPSIGKWQESTCLQTEKMGYITAPSGFRMYYPDNVFNYTFSKKEGKWQKTIGDTAKECIAAVPQHMGMMFSAKAMALAVKDEFLASGLMLSIHDELLGEWGLDKWEEANVRLQGVMEVPMAECPLPPEWNLGSHLYVKTGGKKGLRWSELKKC